jgi:hypothetical protein
VNVFEQIGIVHLRLRDDYSNAVGALHATWPRPGLDLHVERDILSEPKDQIHATGVKLVACKYDRIDSWDLGSKSCHTQIHGQPDDCVAQCEFWRIVWISDLAAVPWSLDSLRAAMMISRGVLERSERIWANGISTWWRKLVLRGLRLAGRSERY